MKFIDLTGARFERLTVLARAENAALRNIARWKCKCDCGEEKIVRGHHLRAGKIRSCGCLYRESIGNLSRTHAMTNTPTFNVWQNMIQRCSDKKHKSYKNYGGRGIKVCERWKTFVNFLADMGIRPDGLTLERKNNDGNYEPCNCKWATREEQLNNTRRNRFLIHNGERKTLSQWARVVGISPHLLSQRIDRDKVPLEKALSQ